MKTPAKAVFAAAVVVSATAQPFDFNTKCEKNSYYSGFDPSDYNSASSLQQALHDLIDGHNIIPYGSTDEAMLIIDAANDGTQAVIGVYSQLPKHPFPDEWNREHVWPRSRGVGDSGADTSDIHHLYPSDMNLNSARGNKVFDECTPGVGGCVSPAGTSTEDAAPGSSETSTTWAPPPSMRGDLARAIFYMATRYDGSDSSTTDLKIGECSSSCSGSTFGRLSTLLKWNQDDPVDAKEIARMEAICGGWQGNRNPYVDFPELVSVVFDPAVSELTFGPEQGNDNESESSGSGISSFGQGAMAGLGMLGVIVAGVLVQQRRAAQKIAATTASL